MSHRILLFSLLIIISCLLTGCWGHNETNDLAIIHSVAIDKGEKNKIRVTVEISNTKPSSSPMGIQTKPIYLSIEGITLFDAGRLLREKSSRELLWGHTSAIIFSQEVAREGLKKHIDTFKRLRHYRNSTNVYITEGKAADIFKAKVPQQSLIAFALNGLIKTQELTATTEKVNLITVYQTLINRYNDLTIPAVHITKLPFSNKRTIEIKGLYCFHGDRLVSFLDQEKTKGYLRVLNKVEGTVERIPYGKKNNYITFENIHNHAKIKPLFTSLGKPTVKIEASIDYNIVGVQPDIEKISDQLIQSWEKKLNDRVKKQIRNFITYTQKNGTDSLGLGETFHREYPKEWKQIKGEWVNMYPKLAYTIDVKSHIGHTNLLTSPK
jgi:spore germination protein KC